jgi:hypothetical protein
MAMYGVDCEESTLGQDVAKDSRSYFGHLLNQGLCWGGYRTGMVPVSDVDGMVFFPFWILGEYWYLAPYLVL